MGAVWNDGKNLGSALKEKDFIGAGEAGMNIATTVYVSVEGLRGMSGEQAAKPLKGMQNPNTKAAVNLGNKVHYDQYNGGQGAFLPTELSQRYPNTQFKFTRRGAKGADVEVVGGTHPSLYIGSTWQKGNNFGDFKSATDTKFNSQIKSGKLPVNTQKITYSPVTGKLQ